MYAVLLPCACRSEAVRDKGTELLSSSKALSASVQLEHASIDCKTSSWSPFCAVVGNWGSTEAENPALKLLEHVFGHLASMRRGAEARQSRYAADSSYVRRLSIRLLPWHPVLLTMITCSAK